MAFWLEEHVLAWAELGGIAVPEGKRREVLSEMRRALDMAIQHERWKNEGGPGVDGRTARLMLQRLEDERAHAKARPLNASETGQPLADAYVWEMRTRWVLDSTQGKRDRLRNVFASSVRNALVTLVGTDATMALLAEVTYAAALVWREVHESEATALYLKFRQTGGHLPPT